MSIKFYKQDEHTYHFICPGCNDCMHFINTDKTKTPCWNFNGNVENPTVSPSIRVRYTIELTDEQHAQVMRGEPFQPQDMCCHFFIRDGNIEYCGDSTHEFAGQTIAIPDWDKA